MSLFIDTLADGDEVYEYGHCYQVHPDGSETGCGMEYAYYLHDNRLEFWHDAVGFVHTRENFSSLDQEVLVKLHETCHVV